MDRSFNSGGKLFSRQHRTQLLLAAFAFTCAVTCAPVSAVSAAADKKWLDLQHAGTTALDSNEYWKAEPLLKSAVIEAGSFGQDDLRLAKSIGELGRLYTVRGRFTDAEPLLEEELCIKQRALGIGSGQVVPAMGKMVRFYFLYGSISKADPLTEDILAVVENKLREPVDQASPKLTLKKGAPLVGWAGSAAPIARDPILEWAITCDDLGSLYRLRQNYAMADRLFKDGLDLKATVLGKQHLSLANSYDSLAEICSSKDEFRDAESYFTEAVELTEKILSSGDPAVYKRLDKLARCYIKEHKYKEAEDIYHKALNSLPRDAETSGTRQRFLLALGCLYDDERNFSAAAPVLQEALGLAIHNCGPESSDLAPYLRKLGYTLYYLGRKGEMEQYKARASYIVGDTELARPVEYEQPMKAEAKSLGNTQ